MTHLKNLFAYLCLSRHSSSCHPFIFANPQGMVRLVLLWVIVKMVIASPFLCFAEESLFRKILLTGWVQVSLTCLKWMANIRLRGHPKSFACRLSLATLRRSTQKFEADIERIRKVGSYASFWYMSLHTLPPEKKPRL